MLQIGWPQGLILLFMLIPVIIHVGKHGERLPEPAKYNGYGVTLRFLGGATLLYWGGFFQ